MEVTLQTPRRALIAGAIFHSRNRFNIINSVNRQITCS